VDDPPDGWGEPRLRVLRTAAAVVVLVLLVWLIVVEPSNDTGAIGTMIGALLIILGFETLRRNGK
jgi:uncharacterized BrkB/YihY/UPF0761 family membrane protein